jgi:hypothetical protein
MWVAVIDVLVCALSRADGENLPLPNDLYGVRICGQGQGKTPTRNSAILSELPKPSPSLSVPEYIPTTNIGD